MRTLTNILRVNSLESPELQPYRTLRRPLEHIKKGIFVAEGEKVVARLLDSELTIVSMLLTPEWFEEISSSHRLSIDLSASEPVSGVTSGAEKSGTSPPALYIAEHGLLETIVGYNLHQGIMAVARIPEERSMQEIIGSIPHPHLLVALDGLVSAENVGVVVRNCAAFGVHAIIVGETSSSPYLRRAVRNSMGTIFHVPVVHSDNLAGALSTIHGRYGTRIVAAHPHDRSDIRRVDLTGNLCIVFGNEGDGISRTVLDACSERVAIPMASQVDSLNVASASAVFLYEAKSQRGD